MLDLVWKVLPDTDGKYLVSNTGEVKSLKRKDPLVLAKACDKDGYHLVTIRSKEWKPTQKVHRLVALLFLPNPYKLSEVNHKDEDKTNNNVSNLEWCTTQYNTKYSQAKSYTLVSPDGEVIDVFNLRAFCRDKGLNQGNIMKVLNGKYKQHKGYTALSFN